MIMDPVSRNRALIPRRPSPQSEEEPQPIFEEEEVRPFVSYAPPGATLRARVRRLPEGSGSVPPVNGLEEGDDRPGHGGNGKGEKPAGNGSLVLR
ncbi:MAG TPA: hypothetical protein ENI92_02110, partial [Bacteroidetes bacterium]|nr:hypothetical protein [Bacteroidota bacterium]